jgi:hypothetical protein
MGVAIQAATVIATLSTFDMSLKQSRSYMLINIVDIKEKIRLKALHVLQTTYKLK